MRSISCVCVIVLASNIARGANYPIVGLDPIYFNDSGWRWGAFAELDTVDVTNEGIVFNVPPTENSRWPGTVNGGIGVNLDGLELDTENHELEVTYRALDDNEASRFRVALKEIGTPDTGEEYQYFFDLNRLPIGQWTTVTVPLTKPSFVWTLGGDGEPNFGMSRFEIQSTWNTSPTLNIELGSAYIKPIDQSADDVIFELNANNFRTGYVRDAFADFDAVVSDFETITIDAESHGKLGLTWISADFDHETHEIVVRAKRGPNNTAEEFLVGFTDEDGLEALNDLSGDDYFFDFSTDDFSTDEFTSVRRPFSDFVEVENFDLFEGDGEMNFGAYHVFLETIEDDFSRFNMEIESIQIVKTPSGIPGDFNNNQKLDTEDVDILASAIRNSDTDARFDLNSDGMVDAGDHTHWIKDESTANTWIGDANLDGEFNSSDFVQTFAAGKYELDLEAGWSEGDWNADNQFDSRDLVAAFQDGGYEMGPRAAVTAVPEPTCGLLLAIGVIGMCRLRTRRHSFHSM